MKKVLLAIILTTAFAFTPVSQTKVLKVEASLPEWDKHYQKLEVIKRIVDNSNLNNQEVKFIVKSIDSLQMLIVPQLQKQIADTVKKK